MTHTKLKIVTIVGTRPEIIRLSRTMARLDEYTNQVIVHTGQNYDYELNEVFWKELELRKPDHFLEADTSSLGATIGDILRKTEELLQKEKPDGLLVLGDTNSCLSAYIAKRMHIPVFHMEAGNRSFDFNVPEETNRRIIDHIADFNLVYTEHARRHLLSEGLPHRRIYLTGSPMREVLNFYRPKISQSEILAVLGLEKEKYFVVSTHREENVDNPANLKKILVVLEELANRYDLPVIVSTHPRTRKRIGLSGETAIHKNIQFLKPFGFLDYVHLQQHALCTLSDSGTISEESSILGFPAISLRQSMERPEAQDTGSIILTGFDPDVILNSILLAIKEKSERSVNSIPADYQIEDTFLEGSEINSREYKIEQQMVGHQRMKLIFVSSGQYPNGGAATNRHLAYAKGLKELGYEVEFLLLNKQQWSEREPDVDGIKFTCVHVPSFKKPTKINKARSFFKSVGHANEKIAAAHKKGTITALILLDISAPILIPLLRHGKKLQLKIFHERTEYPFVVSSKTLAGKIDLYIYLKFLIKRFDGIYVINNALKNYFSAITNGKVPVIVINMIVDPARFECGEVPKTKTIITFCGSLDGDKDGVPILIESFAMIANEFPSLKLQLIGSLNQEATRQNIEALIQKLHIKGRVIVTGSVKRDAVPALLCNSDILALARPANKQAEGGFPTKLGEYLATGNTVVVTNVGEIGLFLKDKINAFISEPGSAEKFSQKLREALLHADAARIGAEGKKLVYNDFNYLTQAKVLDKMFLDVRPEMNKG